jgi:hypothetical protein
MKREGQPQTNEVLVDVSQYTAESARLPVEQQLSILQTERRLLTKRRTELEAELSKGKMDSNRGKIAEGVWSKTRSKLVQEFQGIELRLQEIKPTMHKLNNKINRDSSVILEEILLVLKKIETKIEAEK